MPTQITCPQCDRKLKVPDESLGKKIRCPVCKSPFVAGGEEEKPAPSAPRAQASAARSRAEAARRKPADEEEAPRKKPRKLQEEEEDSPELDERPKKKIKQQKSGSPLLFVLLLVGCLVVAGGVVGLGFALGWFGKKEPETRPTIGGKLGENQVPVPQGQKPPPPAPGWSPGMRNPDLDSLQGKWEAIEAGIHKAGGGTDISTYNLRFQGDRAFRPGPDGSELVFTVRIDHTKRPKPMDLVFNEGTPGAIAEYYIYELEGDKLTLYSIPGGGPRPKSFSEPGGVRVVLKRAR